MSYLSGGVAQVTRQFRVVPNLPGEKAGPAQDAQLVDILTQNHPRRVERVAQHIHTLREAVAPVEVYKCADESEWDGTDMKPFKTHKKDLPEVDKVRRFKVTDVKGRPCYPQDTPGEVADDDAEEETKQFNTGNTQNDLKALLKALQLNVTEDDDSAEAKAFLDEQALQKAIEKASKDAHKAAISTAEMKEKNAEVKTIMEIMSSDDTVSPADVTKYNTAFVNADAEKVAWGSAATDDALKAARLIWHEFNTCADVTADKCDTKADVCAKVSRSKFGPSACAPKRLVASAESDEDEGAQEAALRKIWKDLQVSASKKKLPERAKEARAYNMLTASSGDDTTTDEEAEEHSEEEEAQQVAMRNRTGLRRTGRSVMRGGGDTDEGSSSDSDY